MKKIVLALFLAFCFIKADIVSDGIALIKKESFRQDALADAIELYVENFGVNPTSLSQIQSAGLIDASFSFSGSFSIATTSFTITSSITNIQQYQKDYFLNDFARNRVVSPTVSGDNIVTTFYLGKKAIYSKNIKSSGVTYVQPYVPIGSANQTWWDTSKQQMYFYIGGWKNLSVKKLWILRNTTELSATALAPNENDGAIIHDGANLSKYLFVSGAWRLIPQTIPFSYNGAF